MQSRNGDPSGDKPWTRVHHWHHPVFSASQRVPGKETAGRGGSFALQFLSSSSFPWTRLHNSRILMSYVLGRRRSTSLFPSSVWYLTGSLCCVILMFTHRSLSSSNLGSVILGSRVSTLWKEPLPHDSGEGSLEVYSFYLEALLQKSHEIYQEMDVFCTSAHMYT